MVVVYVVSPNTTESRSDSPSSAVMVMMALLRVSGAQHCARCALSDDNASTTPEPGWPVSQSSLCLSSRALRWSHVCSRGCCNSRRGNKRLVEDDEDDDNDDQAAESRVWCGPGRPSLVAAASDDELGSMNACCWICNSSRGNWRFYDPMRARPAFWLARTLFLSVRKKGTVQVHNCAGGSSCLPHLERLIVGESGHVGRHLLVSLIAPGREPAHAHMVPRDIFILFRIVA